MQSAMAQDDKDDPQVTDELPPGTSLLHKQYTIEKFLSSGGFGITYLARDSLNRRVVIKECFPHAVGRRSGLTVVARTRSRKGELGSIVRKFVREAWALSKLKHPNILSVHQIFEENDTAYMVVEYVDGYDLAQSIANPDLRLSPKTVTEILRKLLSAISLIHDQDMLHRDISPDNILIDRETLNPYLIDFGAAREGASQSDRALSEVRVVKDGYSPEEFYADGNQGPFSDLYALAATFYHVIRGEAPPIAHSRLFAVATQQPDPYTPLDLAVEGYTPSFIAAINRSLQVLPKDRLQSAREWLEMIAVDGDSAAVTVAPSKAGASPAPAPASGQGGLAPARPAQAAPAAQADAAGKSKAPLLASVAVVAVLGGAAVMFGLQPATEAPAPPSGQAVANAPDAAAPVTAEAAAPDLAAGSVVPDPAPDAVAAAPAAPVLPEGVELISPAPAATAAAEADTRIAASAPEGIVLPEGVELIAPAPAGDALPASDAADPAVAEAAPEGSAPTDPATLVLPEGVELIRPASDETASVAPEPAPIAEAEPEAVALETAAAEALVVDLPLSTDLALNAVIATDGLLVPFFNDGADLTRIAGLMTGAEDWMTVGLRIVEVNGTPIQSFDEIPRLLQDELAAAVAAGASSVPVSFGVEPFAGAAILGKPMQLAIVPQVSVAGKVAAQTLTVGGKTHTVVSAIAPGVETELKVGDRLMAFMAPEGQVDLSDNLGTVLMQQIALGNRTLNFMVEREGAIWLAALKLDLEG